MIRKVVINHPSVSFYVAKQAKTAFVPGFDHSIGIVDEQGHPQGGVIIGSCTGSTCLIHVAGRDEKWLSRDLIWMVFHYAFVQLGCVRILAIMEAANEPAVKLNLHFGFRELYRIERMFPSGDGLLTAMDRENCLWLRLKPRAVRFLQETSDGGR